MTGYSLGTGLFGNQYPTHIIGNYYTLKDNLTYARGPPQLQGGHLSGPLPEERGAAHADAGAFTFTDTQANATGIALANLLIGRYDTYTESDAAPYPILRYNQIELYAQDHWQVRANITLDYGVRYQYMPAMYQRDNVIATFDPSLYDPAQAPQPASTGNLIPGTGLRLNGMPVVGIAIAGANGVPAGLYRRRQGQHRAARRVHLGSDADRQLRRCAAASACSSIVPSSTAAATRPRRRRSCGRWCWRTARSTIPPAAPPAPRHGRFRSDLA